MGKCWPRHQDARATTPAAQSLTNGLECLPLPSPHFKIQILHYLFHSASQPMPELCEVLGTVHVMKDPAQ